MTSHRAIEAGAVVVVLLAAGEGRRYGGLKQLAAIDGEPMVRRAARIALDSGAPLLVVTGAEAAPVEAALAGLPLQLVRHAGWRDGMGSSLAAGIRQLALSFPHASAALLCLADQPLVDGDLLRAMRQRHAQAPDRVLVTGQDDVSGPPVLFPHDCFAALMACAGPRGAHALIAREAARVECFSTTRSIDVDTPADLQRIRDWLATDAERR